MWTIIRFTLSGADEKGYRRAFEVLRRAGFREHHVADSPRACEAFLAAVVGDAHPDPSVVARAVFEALADARLAPVMVSGSHVRPERLSSAVPLASA